MHALCNSNKFLRSQKFTHYKQQHHGSCAVYSGELETFSVIVDKTKYNSHQLFILLILWAKEWMQRVQKVVDLSFSHILWKKLMVLQ